MTIVSGQTHPAPHTSATLSYQPWLVCFSAALFFFYEFIQMNMFNAVSTDLMRDFSLHATKLGKLSAYYFYANLIFLPIAGVLLDRFSTRLIILSALLFCVAGITGFSITHSFPLACTFRFMSGVGSAFCFLSSVLLAAHWFPARQMALVTGLIITMAMSGGMIAQTPLIVLIQLVGWRTTLLLDAGLGLFIFVVIFYVVQDYPPGVRENGKISTFKFSNAGILTCWRLAYCNLQNLLCGIYTSLINAPIALFGAIWGSLFLQQTTHFSAREASLAPSLLFLGTMIGGPVVGWVSDKIQKRIVLMMVGAIISLLLSIVVICLLQILSLVAILFLFFALGFFTSSQVLCYPLVAENNMETLKATAVSVVSFFAIGGYAVLQPLFGWLMDYGWQGNMENNVRIYSASDYHHALLILPLGFCIALLATLWIRESKRI